MHQCNCIYCTQQTNQWVQRLPLNGCQFVELRDQSCCCMTDACYRPRAKKTVRINSKRIVCCISRDIVDNGDGCPIAFSKLQVSQCCGCFPQEKKKEETVSVGVGDDLISTNDKDTETIFGSYLGEDRELIALIRDNSVPPKDAKDSITVALEQQRELIEREVQTEIVLEELSPTLSPINNVEQQEEMLEVHNDFSEMSWSEFIPTSPGRYEFPAISTPIDSINNQIINNILSIDLINTNQDQIENKKDISPNVHFYSSTPLIEDNCKCIIVKEQIITREVNTQMSFTDSITEKLSLIRKIEEEMKTSTCQRLQQIKTGEPKEVTVVCKRFKDKEICPKKTKNTNLKDKNIVDKEKSISPKEIKNRDTNKNKSRKSKSLKSDEQKEVNKEQKEDTQCRSKRYPKTTDPSQKGCNCSNEEIQNENGNKICINPNNLFTAAYFNVYQEKHGELSPLSSTSIFTKKMFTKLNKSKSSQELNVMDSDVFIDNVDNFMSESNTTTNSQKKKTFQPKRSFDDWWKKCEKVLKRAPKTNKNKENKVYNIFKTTKSLEFIETIAERKDKKSITERSDLTTIENLMHVIKLHNYPKEILKEKLLLYFSEIKKASRKNNFDEIKATLFDKIFKTIKEESILNNTTKINKLKLTNKEFQRDIDILVNLLYSSQEEKHAKKKKTQRRLDRCQSRSEFCRCSHEEPLEMLMPSHEGCQCSSSAEEFSICAVESYHGKKYIGDSYDDGRCRVSSIKIQCCPSGDSCRGQHRRVICSKASKASLNRIKSSWNDIMNSMLKHFNKKHERNDVITKKSREMINDVYKNCNRKNSKENPTVMKVIYVNAKTKQTTDSYYATNNYIVNYVFVGDVIGMLSTTKPLFKNRLYETCPIYPTKELIPFVDLSVYTDKPSCDLTYLPRNEDGLLETKNLMQIVKLFESYKSCEIQMEKRRQYELRRSLEQCKPFFYTRKRRYFCLTGLNYEVQKKSLVRRRLIREISLYSIVSVTALIISVYILVFYYYCNT